MPCFKLAMDRYVLTDAQWAKMEPHCRGKKSDPGRSGADNRRWLLSASGVMEACGGGFRYDDGSRRSAVAGEHEGFLSSWPQWTRSTSHPCLTTRSALPWCASTAGQRASVALDATATRWSGPATTTPSPLGSGIAARPARRALTTSA